ncbi:MAG: type I glutamate--ammonia ligase [Candidatus Marinimicrobia bacterium]|nr:type I glutamate--ammonia ligase [Candidatus Neomarinimicrobiota bacterium]
MAADREEVYKLAKKSGAQAVDLKFMDFPGSWQHFTVPIRHLNDDMFDEGLGFDGSSIRGWKEINESDMLVIPDPTTAIIDPFLEPVTLSLVCDVHNPITKERYSRCPRFIAQKAENYFKSTSIGDKVNIGPEAEFFIFDDVRFDQTENSSFYMVDSTEGRWNSGTDEGPNLAHKPRYKGGYFPVPPTDSLSNLRSEMMLIMEASGLEVEAQHHEVATGGQSEIDLKYNTLLKMADGMVLFKYIIKNTARKHNKTATFMPKPLFADNGTGMHTHISLWKGKENLFAGTEYAGLSEMGMHFIGGLLKHGPAVVAFTNPTTNSYKRLVPGYEAPVNLAYSQSNRSAVIRIPMYSASPNSKRIEFRVPDPSCNPYLAFSAILMAGLDGIQNKIDPGEPLDRNIYDLKPEELKNVPGTPGTLEEALNALKDDHEFLLKGDVMTEDVLNKWVEYKMENEVNEMRLRPHPYEFALYYDV